VQRKAFTRRKFVTTSAAASATMVAAPFVHTAGAAGNLTLALWDHWVPGANTAMTEICQAWAEKEKVNLQIDYLSTQGNKLYLTIAAEALAKSGHDIMDFSAWEPGRYASSLEPVDDVMKEVLARNGAVGPEYEYLAKPKGSWLAVPGIRGTLCLTACSRIDLMKQHAGIDLLAMFPAGSEPTKAAEAWTWDAFLVAAEKCHKAGFAFGPGGHHRRQRVARCIPPCLRCGAGRCQGQCHGEVRAGAEGVGVPPAACRLPATRRERLGQCLQ
jgi:ABC-type glycerol-3-phosphate transport system substrate-binding protein